MQYIHLDKNVVAVPRLNCPIDIIFAMDESGSITPSDFELMKSFLTRLITRLDIDSGNTRVGLVTYYDDIGSGFNLSDHTSLLSIQAAISSLIYGGGGTMTSIALRYVRTTMLTSAAGDRPNVPNVVVVLTDGQSQIITATKVSVRPHKCFFHVLKIWKCNRSRH